MNNTITLRLSEQIGICSGGICHILLPHYAESVRGNDSAITESYGFLLAYLCHEQGIDLDEAGCLIACLVGRFLNGDKNSFLNIASTVDFYLRILVKKNSENDFFYWSIIIYNLLHPNIHDDFSTRIPIEEISFFDMTKILIELKRFLAEVLPKKINPILENI